MFKLSRRANILRALGILVVVIITITTALILKKQDQDNTKVNAAVNQTVWISDNGYIDDYYPESGRYYYTGKYFAKDNDGNMISPVVFCAQPTLAWYPTTGTAKKPPVNSTHTESDYEKMRLMAYIFARGFYDKDHHFYGAGYSHVAENAGDTIYELFTDRTIDSNNLRQAYAHAIISSIYDPSVLHDYYDESTSQHIEAAISQLQTWINESANVAALARNFQLLYVNGSAANNYQDMFWIERNDLHGTIYAEKCDSVTRDCGADAPQGNATFVGITFELVNVSGFKIYNTIDKAYYNNNQVVATKTIESNGEILAFENLQAGPGIRYLLREKNSNPTYQNTSTEQTITLDEDGEMVTKQFFDDVTTIDATINKSDIKNGNNPQGNATFTGITFKLKLSSSNPHPIIYGSRTINPGQEVTAIPIADGQNSVIFTNLPYAKYEVTEAEPSATTGYQPNGTVISINPSSDGTTPSKSISNTPKPGKIIIQKQDENGDCPSNGSYFAGTKFEILNNSDNAIWYQAGSGQEMKKIDGLNNPDINQRKITEITLGNNQCSATIDNLPFGQYIIKETEASPGFEADEEEKPLDINENTPTAGATVTFKNNRTKISITVYKRDIMTDSCTTQGNTSFIGTTFVLRRRSSPEVEIQTAQITSANPCSVTFTDLDPSYDDYEVVETVASTGYQRYQNPVQVDSNNTATIKNTPVPGSITVQKRDSQTGTTPSGSSTFNGTKFRLTNTTGKAIWYKEGNSWVKVDNLGTIEKELTNDSTSAVFDGLPYGTYTIEEIAVGSGYKPSTEQPRTITIPTDNDVNITAIYDNNPELGSITVEKKDKETNSCDFVNGFTLVGTTFQLFLAGSTVNPIQYGGQSIAPGQLVTEKTLTAQDNCTVTFSGLPYGTYVVEETSVAEGYMNNDPPRTIKIPEDGTNALNIETTFENQVKRGDVKFIKKDASNNEILSNVIFSITNNATGESHIVVTDQNGEVDTSAIPHTKNTNGYDSLYAAGTPIEWSNFGTWFGGTTPNDSFGALPYGTYTIKELECRANLFCYEIASQQKTITINSDKQVINLGDWNNACTVFSLKTTATDEKDGDKFVEINRKARIKDTIEYCVTPGLDFTIKGILMDKSTEQPLLVNGKPIEQVIHLNSETECGTTSMTFKLNAATLAGKDVVVFESLYYEDELITSHKKIKDEDQTVTIVSLYTYATNKENDEKILAVDKDVEIKDTVKYCVKPGLQYTVKGVLMNKETKEPVLINGNPIEQTATFVPEKACGELDMYLALNTTGLGGGQFVIFESLYLGEKPLDEKTPIIEHKDFDNEAESIIVEPPVPNTGLFTRKTTESTTQNDSTIFIIGGFAIVIAIGGYGITRTFSRRNFFRK